mmetsp:Transcript_24255/g.37400  ORF Transcript_24255/g.37400 Transcript_24255/m.37400 type:complete len:91 (+) Transcript_24255:273-545(+)|eukprot:CAMPEP_0170491566 /NCGR_PEP_ID=MMETSP0208-20121228/11126_1 /TAXON_ID=197538 /ORGANISM="Strombidium inclinatum, Strain S3" /LENGTH=90 /DNA_ID=CAMNT_0010767161 /DNA_START=257 /DNA_END=529 /DNA_ORIENTATION=+
MKAATGSQQMAAFASLKQTEQRSRRKQLSTQYKQQMRPMDPYKMTRKERLDQFRKKMFCQLPSRQQTFIQKQATKDSKTGAHFTNTEPAP